MVTLTGTFTRLDGDPATGTVRVTPSRSPIMDSAGQVVISGPQTFPLDQDGKLTVQIPASNDPDLGPAFTYSIDVNLTHASWKISKVWIPHGSTTVDLSEIGDYQPVPGVATRVVTIPADGADGQVLVWDGAGFTWMDPPKGDKGDPGEVTTAALTTALAGKVTGAGMSVRRDTTVGERVLLDHPGGTIMLYGDTGWRTLTSWDSAGTVTGTPLPDRIIPVAGTAGAIRIRRKNDITQLRIHGATISAPVPVALPTGFGATAPYERTQFATAFSPNIFSGVASPGLTSVSLWVREPFTADGIFGLTVNFNAVPAWPTVLPGTP